MILRAAYRVPILARVGAPAPSKILLYSAGVYPTTSQIEVAVKNVSTFRDVASLRRVRQGRFTTLCPCFARFLRISLAHSNLQSAGFYAKERAL